MVAAARDEATRLRVTLESRRSSCNVDRSPTFRENSTLKGLGALSSNSAEFQDLLRGRREIIRKREKSIEAAEKSHNSGVALKGLKCLDFVPAFCMCSWRK